MIGLSAIPGLHTDQSSALQTTRQIMTEDIRMELNQKHVTVQSGACCGVW